MDINLQNLDKEMAKRTLKQYCSSWNEVRYDEIHNKPYFIGKRYKNSEAEALCPINCNKILTFNQLKASVVDSGAPSVNLAIYSSDSTVVLYKAHMGLKPPVPIEESKNILKLDDSHVSISRPLKKRKVNSTADNPVAPIVSEQNDTNSTSDCLQINLQTSCDSELSDSEHAAARKDNVGLK